MATAVATLAQLQNDSVIVAEVGTRFRRGSRPNDFATPNASEWFAAATDGGARPDLSRLQADLLGWVWDGGAPMTRRGSPMTRRGSARYQPITYPDPATIRMPDVALLGKKKEYRLVEEIAIAARANVLAIQGDGGELSQALGELEGRFLDLMNPGEESDPPGTPGIVTGIRLGFVIGTLENESGVAHPNESEVHYTTAMTLISSEFAQKVPPTAMSEFATECGYFLARSGDNALDTLTKLVEKNAENLSDGVPATTRQKGARFPKGLHVHSPPCRIERELRTVLREQ